MSSRRNSLTPPDRRDTVDPGAHDLAEASDSEEHYSDAQSKPTTPARASPIPRTRVERVDDKPAYGEVPGTPAYRLREGDAAPDEIAIIPDASTSSELEQPPRSPTPGGYPVPKMVLEETPDAEGSVTHPENRQRRKSDAHPDLVVKADGKVEQGGATNEAPLAPSLDTPTTTQRARRKSSSAMKQSPLSPGFPGTETALSTGDGDDDDFGDEFDDFEEGGEDGEFDDFEDGFQSPDEQQQPRSQPPQPPPPPPPPPVPATPSLSFPIPTFDDLGPSEIASVTEPYLAALFPTLSQQQQQQPPLPAPSARENPVFLTPRSASLWSQLVAPPPLQPPDWIRSRIRRLFLVSLGVPVDLDEILPASSKQKKLVLPSLHRTTSSGSLRRASSDSRGAKSSTGSAAAAGAGDGSRKDSGVEGSSQAGDPSSSSSRRQKKADASRRQPSPERLFDLVSARQMCMLTDAALSGMTDAELRAHIARLEAMQGTAQGVLAYWQKRTDEKIGDREAFEGVIENLVKHARKVRK
ncbi:hypothetical protein C7999DRAFT_27530 [Corynascus novoguineensis]|uniref:Uncharacterized protein n=1 Tax=Corynascus novoguineensis TaxID=1126955 RepID=A0AAN7D0Q4_9PEZI|nr:hypothetical protein C7999DRAFT_27530 [Corynascus novoguineensis]